MFIYLVIFAVAFALFFAACKAKNNIISAVLLSSTILLLSLFAGFRDETVGTDMGLYIVRVWEMVCSISNIQEFIMISEFTSVEYGYLLFNYIISLFTNELFYFLFWHQFIISGIFVYIAYKERDNFNSIFVLMLFLLTFYIITFNLARQSIAIAFVFLSFYLYYYQHQKIATLVSFLIALSLHNSVIFALLIPLIDYFVSYKKLNTKIIYLGIVIGTVFLYISFQTVLRSFLEAGVFSEKYEHYVDQTGYSAHKTTIAFYLLCFVIIHLMERKNLANRDKCSLFKIYALTTACISLLGDNVEVANRIADYTALPLYFMPLCIEDRVERSKIYYVLFAASLVIWIYLAYSTGHSECIPYTSRVLGL